MAGKFHHEQLYRGDAALRRLAELRIVLCGAGAVGSHMADNLARQGVRHVRAIDFDKVEEHNVSTQLYGEAEVGLWKVEALRNRLFRATGAEIEPLRKELTPQNARQLIGGNPNDAPAIVIDAFDNNAARSVVQAHCRSFGIPCLHVGLSADYGEIIWDDDYRVPRDVAGDVCDYPLARNLILLATAVASETIVRYAIDGTRSSWSVTLGDFAVKALERK